MADWSGIDVVAKPPEILGAPSPDDEGLERGGRRSRIRQVERGVEHHPVQVRACPARPGAVRGRVHIAKLTVFAVDWTPDKMAALGERVARAAGSLGFDPTKAVTLIGVAALGEPDLLVEIEATAVLA